MNVDLLPTSHRLAAQCGVAPTNVQRMKASFLDDEDDDDLAFGLSPKLRGLCRVYQLLIFFVKDEMMHRSYYWLFITHQK